MPEITSSRYLVQAGWDDVPHLDEKTKKELLSSTQPYLREARSKGTPSLGAGAIYPIPLEEVQVEPFAIPAYWKRAYALDVGWNRTACLWIAYDPSDSVGYLYAEHYRGEALPVVHVQAIKARGAWIPGVIDPAARGRGQADGERLMEKYEDLGLNLTKAINSVDTGIHETWTQLSTGQLKVFKTLKNWEAEYRLYRRDEKGVIVKKNDHLMDDMRYLVMSGRDVASVQPIKRGGSSRSRISDQKAGY